MPWTEQISDYFNCISLCWNPRIYPYIQSVQTKFNFALDMAHKFNQNGFSLYNNPQILFTIPPH